MKKYQRFLFPVALLFLLPALLPSQYEVERSIEISGKAEAAYDYLVNLEAWNEWSPWYEEDPEALYQYEGIPGVVGSLMRWESSKVGSGEQILTVLEEPNYIESELRFNDPTPSDATGYLRIEEIGPDRIRVVWGLRGHLSYPFQRFFGLLMEQKIGPYYEKGLNNLKARLQEAEAP